MAGKIEPRVLKGFRDYLPELMLPRQWMIERVRKVFESFGFAPLETPCLEYAEIILGKYGGDAEMLLYRFTDNGGRDVALRYDLTVPLARVVAQYGDLPRPFKRYQIAPVWRAEKPGKGRFREFWQCDVDIVGTESLLADAECVQIDSAVMRSLGIENFTIRLNNRKILVALGKFLGLAAPGEIAGVLRTIDKLEHQGIERVRELLRSDNGLSDGGVSKVMDFLAISAGDDPVGEVAKLFAGIEEAATGAAELGAVIEAALAGGVDPENLHTDLSIARGLDYYTGTVFETNLTDLAGFGSVMSGGRYDGLVAIFSGRDTPAVGISVGLDRLLAGLVELEKIATGLRAVEVFVTVFSEELAGRSLAVANMLRGHGIKTEVSFQAGALGKQFKTAARKGALVALVIGPDETAAGTVVVKDLKSGEQLTVAADGLPETLRRLQSSARPS